LRRGTEHENILARSTFFFIFSRLFAFFLLFGHSASPSDRHLVALMDQNGTQLRCVYDAVTAVWSIDLSPA